MHDDFGSFRVRIFLVSVVTNGVDEDQDFSGGMVCYCFGKC